MRKNAIITGASKGIGKATAIELSKANYNLALIARNKEALEETKKICEETGATCHIFAGDLKEIDFIDKISRDILNLFENKIDVLINNAGVAYFKKFLDISYDELIEQITLNFAAVFALTQKIVPSMIANKNGTIINISSLAGKNGFIGGTAYAATKHAIMGFTKSLMLELREHNIRVIAVCPGSTATDMIIDSIMAPKNIENILKPEDIAKLIASILDFSPRVNISEIDIRPTNP